MARTIPALRPGLAPYGWKNDLEGMESVWVSVDREQAYIASMIQNREMGASYRQIATGLEQAGALGPRGRKWTHVHIRKILQREQFLEESLTKLAEKRTQTVDAGFSINNRRYEVSPGSTIELTKGKWHQCHSCRRRFTLHPEAAGWVLYEFHKAFGRDGEDEWTCEICYQDDFNDLSMWWNKKSVKFSLGHDDQLECKLTFAQVKKKLKEVSDVPAKQRNDRQKLEFELWSQLVKDMPNSLGSGRYGGNQKYLPIVQELVNWKPLPPPAETIKL